MATKKKPTITVSKKKTKSAKGKAKKKEFFGLIDLPDELVHIAAHAPALLIVSARIMGVMIVTPLVSRRLVPMRYAMMIALVLACCVYPALLSPMSNVTTTSTP